MENKPEEINNNINQGLMSAINMLQVVVIVLLLSIVAIQFIIFYRSQPGKPEEKTGTTKTFFEKGGKSLSLGTRAGWKNKIWEASINYTRITKHGRYLLPR